MIRCPKLAAGLALLALLHVCHCHAQSDTPKLKVAIVAVTEFDDKDLQDQLLTDSIKSARDGLMGFFEKNFNVTPTVFTVHDETTSDYLRTWLFRDLSNDSTPSVHLIFFLTHGFAVNNPDRSSFKHEIFLATSETDSKNFYGKSIRGAELIEAFQNLPKRSIMFLFLDSCGSGAIDGENLQKTLTLQPDFATRLMILASALRDQSAFRARFSQTLLTIWQSLKPECHSGRTNIEKFLTASIKTAPGVSPDVEQNVRLVAPGAPDFCIESFNYTQRLAFLFNAAPDDASLSLQAADSSIQDDLVDMRPGELRPVLLRPKTYTMVAKRKSTDVSDGSQVETLELKDVPVAIKVFFSNDPLDKAEADQNVADYLDSREIYLQQADNLHESAAKIGGAVSAVVETKTKRLASEELAAIALLRDASAKLQATQQAIREAETAQAHIRGQLRSGSGVGFTGSEYGAVRITPEQAKQLDEAKQRQQAAELDSKSAAEQLKIAKRKEATLRLARRSLEARRARIAKLRNAAEETLSKKTEVQQLREKLTSQLAKTFGSTHLVGERIIVPLGNANELSGDQTDQFSQLFTVSNKYSLRFELELITQSPISISEQVKARQRVETLLRIFQRNGLLTTAVARAEWVPARDPANDENKGQVQVVLSLQ
ncbi:MAG TPA: hypothetical protein VN310_15395 [Candidatus Dormibacteraeota bacterium]|jgi:hypothetical protein|nr:hypothetical protein [Candidatus Dormibacteraeota bacterium]